MRWQAVGRWVVVKRVKVRDGNERRRKIRRRLMYLMKGEMNLLMSYSRMPSRP
jgi:hypothetical protein